MHSAIYQPMPVETGNRSQRGLEHSASWQLAVSVQGSRHGQQCRIFRSAPGVQAVSTATTAPRLVRGTGKGHVVERPFGAYGVQLHDQTSPGATGCGNAGSCNLRSNNNVGSWTSRATLVLNNKYSIVYSTSPSSARTHLLHHVRQEYSDALVSTRVCSSLVFRSAACCASSSPSRVFVLFLLPLRSNSLRLRRLHPNLLRHPRPRGLTTTIAALSGAGSLVLAASSALVSGLSIPVCASSLPLRCLDAAAVFMTHLVPRLDS